MKTLPQLILLIAILCHTNSIKSQSIMASSLDPIPSGWTGKKFELNKNYPVANPTQPQPWKSFDFKTQPLQYAAAVKQYVLEGNIASDWVFKNNAIRKWYHAPAMIWGVNGREFINGMTRERSSRPKELHPNQTNYWQNWAVGFYSPKGGYALGRVYKVPGSPDVTKAKFLEGTVAAKLLFTNAPVSQVPYLQNAFIWKANIHTAQSGTSNRAPADVRLLQLDVAVKDNRASSTTDWVMLTFVYNNSAPGSTPWDKMVLAGIQWGNDPASLSSNTPLTQSWINPAYTSLFTFGAWTIHTGYQGRLNGPVDNPQSSCLSCHGTAQSPQVSTGVIPGPTPASKALYFRNINPPSIFEDKPGVAEKSLDYSLQLAVGIPAARAHSQEIDLGSSENDSSIQEVVTFLTTRDYDPEELDQINTMAENVSTAQPDISLTTPLPTSDEIPWGWIITGVGVALSMGLAVAFRKRF